MHKCIAAHGICQHLGRPSSHNINAASKIQNSGTFVLPMTVRPHRQPNPRHPELPKWINEGTLRRQPHDSWPHVHAGSLPCKACPRPLIRRHTPNRTVADAQAPPHHIQNWTRSNSEESRQQPDRDCRTGKNQNPTIGQNFLAACTLFNAPCQGAVRGGGFFVVELTLVLAL